MFSRQDLRSCSLPTRPSENILAWGPPLGLPTEQLHQQQHQQQQPRRRQLQLQPQHQEVPMRSTRMPASETSATRLQQNRSPLQARAAPSPLAPAAAAVLSPADLAAVSSLLASAATTEAVPAAALAVVAGAPATVASSTVPLSLPRRTVRWEDEPSSTMPQARPCGAGVSGGGDSLDSELLARRAAGGQELARVQGAYHNPGAASQNLGNHIGTRSCVRQSKLFRMYESGNATKALLGQQSLQWDVDRKEGAYRGRVFDGVGRGALGGDRRAADGREVRGNLSCSSAPVLPADGAAGVAILGAPTRCLVSPHQRAGSELAGAIGGGIVGGGSGAAWVTSSRSYGLHAAAASAGTAAGRA